MNDLITLQSENLCKQYHDGSQVVPVLNNINLTVKKENGLRLLAPLVPGKVHFYIY